MVQYIDKDALVAKIERLKADVLHQIGVYNKVLSLINTLEVKDVDLENEINEWMTHGNITDTRYDDYCDSDIIETAKHFFELGLKTQKGNKI